MPEFTMPFGREKEAWRFAELPPMVQGYIEALFFCNTGYSEDGELEDATFGELAPATIDLIKKTCVAFERLAWADMEEAYEATDYDEQQVGRDLYYTASEQGTGFWDRGDEPVWERLNATARRFPALSFYRGDDGRLYLTKE